MRRQLFLTSVGAIALTGSAFAADLPSRAPPPAYVPPAPIFSWTGLYLGAQVGYAWDTDPSNVTLSSPAAIIPFSTTSFGNSPGGVIGGAHIGYNLQINQWVAGLEGTVDATSINQTATDFFDNFGVRTTTPLQGSIRARAGVALDRILIYATGGAAFTGIRDNYFVPAATDTISKTRGGWTVGGGLEYALTNNWSVRAEYRYSDFGHYNDFPFVTFVVPAGNSLTVQHHLTESQAQVGVSYKFDSPAPAPVVAKY